MHRDRLNDADRAIELFERAMGLAKGQASLVLSAARELEPLLADKGQDEKRCAILERIAEVETDSRARREALGEAARIASDKLEDRERAIRLWRARLEHDPSDREALDTLARCSKRIGALPTWSQRSISAHRSWTPISHDPTVSGSRGPSPASSVARRCDPRWRDVRSQFGIDEESFSALTGLFESLERWDDLAGLLGEQAGATRELEQRVELLSRLGNLFRDRLGAAARATESYRAALALDPTDSTARRGLSALIERPDVHAQVVDGLARAYVETGDFGRGRRARAKPRRGRGCPSRHRPLVLVGRRSSRARRARRARAGRDCATSRARARSDEPRDPFHARVRAKPNPRPCSGRNADAALGRQGRRREAPEASDRGCAARHRGSTRGIGAHGKSARHGHRALEPCCGAGF